MRNSKSNMDLRGSSSRERQHSKRNTSASNHRNQRSTQQIKSTKKSEKEKLNDSVNQTYTQMQDRLQALDFLLTKERDLLTKRGSVELAKRQEYINDDYED